MSLLVGWDRTWNARAGSISEAVTEVNKNLDRLFATDCSENDRFARNQTKKRHDKAVSLPS